MGGSANSLSSIFSQSLDPQPVAATYSVLAQSFTVTFNRNLTPGILNGLNWTMRPGGFLRVGNVVSALANVVSGTTNPHILGPALDTIQYAPPPSDVLAARDSTPAAAFTDYPLTILP